ncbi:MAG: chromosome segregation protein SMC [Gemella sp.]|nr:chromosome segregation protein SMC [Gemella sp.]
MKLKRIEINGFKSFQSTSVLTIDSNLIGIVGPNGSGKSNIIDAIRWVLGEQSAKNLRGNSMKDVIFSGTENKKSKNFAEVSISFDLNSEEHIITRRLYKNGDSEYLLDGKKSKLKDITDIYLDLGISKESYSIITQGRVESILSSKAQDRRIIIEEAAGILKYKNKKRESSLKLEKTQTNISRLQDIFIEIQGRYSNLLEQKKKTELYLKYEEELKEKDISIQVYNIKSHQNKVDEIKLQLAELQTEKVALENEISELENIIEETRKKIKSNDLLYTEYKDKELVLVEEIGVLSSSIDLYEEKKNNSSQIKKKLEEERNSLEKKKKDALELNEKYKRELKGLSTSLKSVNDKIKNERDNSGITVEEIDTLIDELKNKYFDLVNQESKIENELVLNKQILDNKKQGVEVVNQEINKIESLLISERESLEKLESIRKTLDKDKILVKNLESEILKKQKELESKREYLFEKISKGKELFNSTNNKKIFLENQYTSDNYYNVGVKEVLSQKSKINGIYDVLGNVINIKSEYVVALDLALVSSQQNIIVDTPNTARLCVDHLKKINKGRATFLPLSSIKSRNIEKSMYSLLKEQDGFVDIAYNLVEFDKKFDNVLSNLLGVVIVCDNLYNANKIAEIIKYKYRVITLDGQVINSGGSISGGSIYKSSNSLLRTKSELETLITQVTKIEEKLVKLELELETVDKEYISQRNLLDEQKEKIIDLDRIITENDIKSETIQGSISRLEISLEQEMMKLGALSDIRNYSSTQDSFSGKLSSIREEMSLVNDRLQEEQQRRTKVALEKNVHSDYINELHIEKSKLNETTKYKEELLLRNADILSDIEASLSQIQFELNGDDVNYKFINQLPVYRRKLEKNNESLILIKNELSSILQEKDRLFLQETQYNEKQKEKFLKLTELNNNLENLKINSSKFVVKIEEGITYLINNYNITYENAENIFNNVAMVDIPSYKDSVHELKMKINSLGNVNLNAVEEYAEVEERYGFYKAEIDDLLEAKSKLESTIAEIDTEVKERFVTTFNVVSENFSRIYKVLFKGGNAKMTLDNPDNILETGINIMASPPGKNLQMLSLLSGGEKALTALSLLFAILEIKRAPFVILDEVEAALDDVNVLRFAKFLKTYSKENQFLVITHRRGTMEEMDKLYGITMKEKGISYILSLDLNTILKEDFINE